MLDLLITGWTVVDAGAVEWRSDLPAGGGRLYAEPVGITNVVVNGAVIARDGHLIDVHPGRVLRGGRDTVDGPGCGFDGGSAKEAS